MAWFGRSTRDESRPVDADELRRSVDEGFLIAKSALTVSVANRIILDALQADETFDQDRIAEAARAELGRLAEEQRGEAERMRELHAKAQKQKGRSRHQHDYRRGDDLALRTREASYTELAERLDACRDDQAFVDRVVVSARERAWDDIGGTVVDRLGWAQRPTADYEIGRDDRLQQMLDEDFAALVDEHRGFVARPDPDADSDNHDGDADTDDTDTDESAPADRARPDA